MVEISSEALNYTFKTNNTFEAIGVLIISICCVFILIMIIKTLWNSVVPRVFGAKEIDFWDTVILLILSSIFFGRNQNNYYIVNK